MRDFLILILLLNSFAVLAQKKTQIGIEKTKKSKFHFSNLKNSTDLFDFRFWNIGQVLEIRVLPDSTKVGEITSFVTKSYRSSRKQIKIESGEIDPIVYLQKIELSKIQVSKILGLIKKSKITELPSDSEIKNWEPVLDGEWYSFEQNVGGDYKIKNYGNPKEHYELPEGVKFLNFYSELNSILKLKDIFSDFFSDLNYGCYTKNGENTIICKERNKL